MNRRPTAEVAGTNSHPLPSIEGTPLPPDGHGHASADNFARLLRLVCLSPSRCDRKSSNIFLNAGCENEADYATSLMYA